METEEDCPEKLKKILNELKKDHLAALDYFLAMALNLTQLKKNTWLQLRAVLVGKEKVSTRDELVSYEGHLLELQDFLKTYKKQIKKLQMNRKNATVLNSDPILLTDSDEDIPEIPSRSENVENAVIKGRWRAPRALSDINVPKLPIEDIRNNPLDPRLSRLKDSVEPEIISAQRNFQERPPIIPSLFDNNIRSNQFLRKNTRHNPRVSHYQKSQQPQKSGPPKIQQENYRDYKHRKKQAERLANSGHESNVNVSPLNVQRNHDEPTTSSYSNLLGAAAPLITICHKNAVATNEEILNNELAAVKTSHLLEIRDDFFDEEILPSLNKRYTEKAKKIKLEIGFELVPPEEKSSEECSEEIIDYEPQFYIKSEPEQHFSDNDKNTADFRSFYVTEETIQHPPQQYIKEEPLDIQYP